MVRVNGDEFEVFTLDTEQSFISRLAAKMETLPKYLYFNQPININNLPENITVENILNNLGDIPLDVTEFINLYQTITEKNENLSGDDIVIPYIVFNIKLNDMGKNNDDGFKSYIFYMQSCLENEDIFSDLENIWNSRKEYKNSIRTEINNNIKNVKKISQSIKEFNKLQDVRYLPFELEKSVFIMTLDMPITSISEIFNIIQLSMGVPFASFNNFYKILKDFSPPDISWSSVSLDYAIIFKILQKIDLLNAKPDDYTTVAMKIDDDGVIIAEIALSQATGYVSKEQFLARFLEVFKSVPVKINSIKENSVRGMTYFPKIMMNKYILADIVMNNPIFSPVFTINESQRASHKKESVFLSLNNKDVGKVTVYLSGKIAVKGDILMRGKDIKNDFFPGSNFITACISAENTEAVHKTENLLSKLLYLYNEQYTQIANFYRQYIPDFATKVVEQEQLVKLKLKDIAPEIFIKSYPQTCPFQPTIIEDSEVEEAKLNGKVVMRYPLESTPGLPARNYICDESKTAIYPGLRMNRLSNKELTPFLPCCYEKDHDKKQRSPFRHYYYGEPLKEQKNTQQDLIKTTKFAPRDIFGILPDDIANMFEMFKMSDITYVRKGVTDTKSSFIECVLEGLETDIIDITVSEERERKIAGIRKTLANLNNAALCKQQMYDFTLIEIKEMIANNDVYFAPKFFVSLLEEYYNCNIYVFNRDRFGGQLILPRYSHALYKTRKIARSIFIYEHMGSNADHAEYPRCELIVGWNPDNNSLKYFSKYESRVSMGIRSIYNKLKLTYALNFEVTDTIFPIQEINGLSLLEQGIDSYGKCRLIKFLYNQKKYSMFTSPIQPFGLLLVNSWKPDYIPSQEEAIELFNQLGITITGQNSYRDEIYELYGIFGNVTVTLPIEKDAPIPKVQIYNNGLTYQKTNSSDLSDFNFYKKLARYITEYTYWLFSKYLQENPRKSMHSIDTINDFSEKYIVIIPKFVYKSVSKNFSMTSGVMQNGKLVLKSQKALQRLMFVLRLNTKRFSKKIQNYHTRTTIEHYYLDITDFDQHKFQVVLYGSDSVDKWINEQKIKHYIYDSVQVGKQIPYIFKNSLIGDKVYLAQNTDSIEKGLAMSKIWYKNGYNPGQDIDELLSGISYILYVYVSNNDISPYRVIGNITKNQIIILGYKINDIPMFTVLLEF